MIRLTANVRADRHLSAIIDRLESPRQGLEILGGLLEDYEREVFATRGHGAWAANDPATARLKGSGRVLVDTGSLLRELTTAHVTRDSVYVDAGDAFYARFNRDGDRGLPKRNPVPPPSRSTVDGWADTLLGFVAEGRGA